MNKSVFVVLVSLLTSKVIPSLAASQATFSLVATTPTSITVPANRQAHVQYKVTNNTATTRTLTMLPYLMLPNLQRTLSMRKHFHLSKESILQLNATC